MSQQERGARTQMETTLIFAGKKKKIRTKGVHKGKLITKTKLGDLTEKQTRCKRKSSQETERTHQTTYLETTDGAPW